MSNAVLIVDDERHVLQSIQRLLRRDGYEIHLAESGRHALEILANVEIAAIVCDQRMPGMTGAEVLAEAYALHPDTVRITLTGYTDLASAQASINNGHVSQFLLKPWNDEHLRSVVADAVKAYRLAHDNRRLEALTRQQNEELQEWNTRLERTVQERTEELRAQNDSLKQLQARVEQSLRDTVGLLAATLEAHCPNLGIHCKRVAQIARQLASQLELDGHELRDIEFAAHLHDVGKIARSSDDDRSSRRHSGDHRVRPMHRHTKAGYAILSEVSGFETIALAVRHQHEHYDGSGTPNGMSGDAIPLAARIIAVANAYDKAVHPSSDAAEFLPKKGKATLIRGEGSRFDPRLVQLLLEHAEQVGSGMDGQAEVELSPRRLKEGMVLSRPLLNSSGMLLLKGETSLTVEMIQRIRAMSGINPMLAGVFVHCATSPTIERECDTPHTTQKSPPAKAGSTSQPRSTQGTGAQTELSRTPVPHTERAPSRGRTQDKCADKATGSATQRSETRASDSGSAAIVGGSVVPPRAVGKPIQRSALSVPSSANTPARTRSKILVVDDSSMVCNALKRELRPCGIETVATGSGWAALKLIEETRFDAVLIDLMMPAMSGSELVRRLQECAPTLPCIILTGNASKERVMTLSKEPNVVGIMTKPWDRDRLIATITTAIAEGEPEPVRESL